MYPACRQTGSASHEVALPFRVSFRSSLAPILVRRSPHVLSLGRTTGSSRASGPATALSSCCGLLSWTYALLQSPPGLERPPRYHPSEEGDPSTTPPLRSPPLQRLPARDSGITTGLASPGHLHLQVFSTSWRFHPPRAWWPCFMPHPLLGLHPSEPCSSRAAARRLRRRSPLVV
jgi:hypothetical protein